MCKLINKKILLFKSIRPTSSPLIANLGPVGRSEGDLQAPAFILIRPCPFMPKVPIITATCHHIITD